ncbi:MAG: hypothetical protein ABIF10_00265 [Candidatus Woesearchaeota archaeon]
MNKKGINLFKTWAETMALLLLVIGLFVSLLAGSKVITYFIITICGMMFGRLWYRVKNRFRFPWLLLIVGFLLGYIMGNIYGNILIIITLFIFGVCISYHLHNKGKLRSVGY